MIVSANVTKDLITFRSSPSTPDTISVSAQAGQRALTSTPDERCIDKNGIVWTKVCTTKWNVFYISTVTKRDATKACQVYTNAAIMA